MSRAVNHIGVAEEILIDATYGEKLKFLKSLKKGVDLEIYDGGFSLYDPDKEYFNIRERIFKNIEHDERECRHYIVAPQGNNKYAYTLSFYNGGESFNEAFEDALNEIDN